MFVCMYVYACMYACVCAVLADLSSHPTVTYIKQLESQKIMLAQQLKDETDKHMQLHVAFNAQAKQVVRCAYLTKA